jgi:AmpD protein
MTLFGLWMLETFQQFFTNKLDFGTHPYFQTLIGIEVSAHLFIKRGGEVIQFVPFNKRVL